MTWTLRSLAYDDHGLAEVPTPGGPIRLTLGLGSGLSHRRGDPPERLWAVGDRGANLKIKTCLKRYGLDHLAIHKDRQGLKVIPRPELGPTIVALKRTGDVVEVVRTIPLRTAAGRTFSGLPLPGAEEASMEPAISLEGGELLPDPAGADTEAIAALSDGTFWIAEEYGPSLMRVAADGVVLARWLPEGSALETDPPAQMRLPADAARRRLNRGLEALCVSPDETKLHIALQSAIAGEDEVRLWTLDATSGRMLSEHLYCFDPPKSFKRDRTEGKVDHEDLKVCEIACVGENRLLVLERVTASARIYLVTLGDKRKVKKKRLFCTDEATMVAPDLEGMAVVSDRSVILATDNDFGIEGAATSFYEVVFDKPFC